MVEEKFNLEDVKKFFEYFNFKHPVEVRVFDEKKYPLGKSVFCKDQEEFLKIVKQFNVNEEVSVYIGQRDRVEKGETNIVSSSHIFFELETDDETEINKVENLLKENNLEIGMKVFSGRGFHYYIPHNLKELKNTEDREKYKEVLNCFKKFLIDNKINIDVAVFNLERVSRIAGTFNYKRNKLSKIVLYNKNG